MVRGVHIVLILVLAEIATTFVLNDTLDVENNSIKVLKTRRSMSTSSSRERDGGGGGGDASAAGSSLMEVFTSDSSDEPGEVTRPKKKDHKPKSSAERKGWRKWHRKCTQCPVEMRQKWRDPSIKWICGAYQQARRTFKSLCMMHLRNCQDGTMFTKIADHRCPNSSSIRPFGEHFFYDYKVVLTDDSTGSDSAMSEEYVEEDQSSSWSSSRIRTIPPEPKVAYQAFFV